MSTRQEQQWFREGVINTLAVLGYATTPQISASLGERAVTDEAMDKRLQRMASDQLVEQRRADGVPCWVATSEALALYDWDLPYVKEIGATTVRHNLAVAQVAIHLRLAGLGVTTERQLRAEERAHRDARGYVLAPLSASLEYRRVRMLPDGRNLRYTSKEAVAEWHNAWVPKHRPDVRIDTAPPAEQARLSHLLPAAVEIELSIKRPELLSAKLRWLAEGRNGYRSVHYLCGDEAIARAMERAATTAAPALDLNIQTFDPRLLVAAESRRTDVGLKQLRLDTPRRRGD